MSEISPELKYIRCSGKKMFLLTSAFVNFFVGCWFYIDAAIGNICQCPRPSRG